MIGNSNNINTWLIIILLAIIIDINLFSLHIYFSFYYFRLSSYLILPYPTFLSRETNFRVFGSGGGLNPKKPPPYGTEYIYM